MKVIRMENDEHYGPFVTMQGPEFARHVSWAHVVDTPDGPGIQPDETHPHHMKDIPHAEELASLEDPLGVMLGWEPQSEKWRVGVDSMDQFYHWFPKPSLNYFASTGQHLSIYDVQPKYVHEGKYQNMFDRTHAKLVETEDLKGLTK